MTADTDRQATYEYVVVGSGAGGATVAARLAERGHTVLVLEAGGDPLMTNAGQESENRLPEDYLVPMFHAFATENPELTWEYYVRNHLDDDRARRNPRYVDAEDGVLYPRGAALGGSTAHDPMVTVRPQPDQWDHVAELTGDASWRAERMQSYFERLEDCRYRPLWRWLAKLGFNPTRHGFKGWLRTEKAIPSAGLEDQGLAELIASSVARFRRSESRRGQQVRRAILRTLDPNDWRFSDGEGLVFLPLATRDHARYGARERLLEVAQRHPGRLTVELNALATKVLFDDGNRAIGVEYLEGARLYRAHRRPSEEAGQRRRAAASREVILCGGAFNTPQLLKLSGIGPSQELEAHGIQVQVDLPGVGSNLQDVYEVGLGYRMNFDQWEVLRGAHFDPGDPIYQEWKEHRRGLYTTNGTVLSVLKRSTREAPSPDLACYALLGLFQGFYPGFSRDFAKHKNYLTWVIRKTRTVNTAGVVALRSADPRDPPQVTFHYFDEGSDTHGQDLEALVEGIRLVRNLMAPMQQKGLVLEEERPGGSLQSDAEIADYVRFNAWGREASCTCSIGDRGRGGVVNSDFEVHGTNGLRIVDASVFPKTPGPFMSAAIYMIGEKAADVISECVEAGD